MKKYLLIILALCATTLAWGTTVTKTTDQLKDMYDWVSKSSPYNVYQSFNLDGNISVVANSATSTTTASSNVSGIYASPRWFVYQSDNKGSFTISAANGYIIKSVKLKYFIGDNGVLSLKDDATTAEADRIASETVVDVNKPSVTFYTGKSATGTRPRIGIETFEVTYEKGIVEEFKTPDGTNWNFGVDATTKLGTYGEWEMEGIRHTNPSNDMDKLQTNGTPGVGIGWKDNPHMQTTAEGGVKTITFLWNQGATAGESGKTEKITVTVGDKSKYDSFAGAAKGSAPADRTFAFSPEVKSNATLRLEGVNGNRIVVGPITIVPYIFYTTKAASIPLSQDGYKNTDLIDNTDGGTISYASSNTNVATVGLDGTITPIMTGTTTITASWDGVSTSYTLTVTAPTDATNSWTETFSQIDEHTSWGDSKTSTISYQKGDNDVFTWQFRNYRTYTSGDYKIGLRSGWTSPSTNNDYVAQQDVSEGGIKYISMVWVPNSSKTKNPTQVEFTMGDMTAGSILRTFEAEANTLSTSDPITTTMRYNIKKNAQIRVQIPNSATESNEEYNSIKIKSITVTPYLLYTQKKVYKKKGDNYFKQPIINNTDGEGTIAYSSSNGDVAYVHPETGTVTIKGVGYAKITATWTNGSNTVTTFYRLYVHPNGRGYVERFSNAGENTYTPSSSPKSFSGDIKQKDHNTITWKAVSGSITKSGSRALFGDGVNALKVAGNTVLGSNVSFYGGIKYITAFIGQVNDGSGKTISVDLGVGSTIGSNKMVTLNLGTSDKAVGAIPYYTSNSLPVDNSSRTDKQLIYINNKNSNPFYIDSLVIYPYIQYIKDYVIRTKSYPSAAEMKYDVANEDVLINNVESSDGTVTYSITAPATRKSTISGHIVDFSAVTEDETLTITADFVPKNKTNHIKTTFQLKVQVLNTYEPSITFSQTDATNTIRKNITDAAFTPEYILRVNGADHTADIDVTLTSSNPNVISVGENNQLTITGAGTAIITATAPENDECDSRALNASFNVVVTGYEDDTKLIEDYSNVPATTGWVQSEKTFTSAAYDTKWKINHFNTSNSGDVILGQKAVRLSKDNGDGGEINSNGAIEGGIKAVAFDWRINNNGKVNFGVTAGTTTKTAQYDDVIKGQVTHYEQFFGVKSNCNFKFLVNNYTTESFILGPISITPYIYYTTREVFLDIASTPKESFDSKAVLIDNTGDEGTITFSSANTNVATVDANGVITAVGSGETYVTATWSEGATTRIHVITAEKFDRIWNLILGKPEGSGDDNVIVTFNQEIIRDIDHTNKTITILGLGGETKTAVKIATNPASAVNTNWQTIVGSVSNTVIGKWTKNADYNYTFTIENWSALTYLENGEVPPAPDEPLKSTTTTLNNGEDITTTLAAAPATLPLSVTYDDVFVTKIPIEDPSCEFTSSDENVATIDENGQVTVVGIGTAELKAHFLETGKYAESEATISITVNVPEGEQSWTETFSQIDEHTSWQKTSSVTNQKGDNDVFTWQFLNYRTYTSGDYKIGLRSGWTSPSKKNDYVAQQTVSEGGIKYISMVWVPNSNDATNPNPVYFTMGDLTSGSILRTYQAPANSLSTSTPITTMMRYDIKKNAQLRVQIKNSEKESPEEYNSMKIKSITVTPYLLYTTKFHKIDVANGESDTWTNEDLINNTDGGTIVYSIEDIEGEGVAEIDAASGQVTAKSNGKAKVTATWTPADAKSGEVVTTTYEVEVFMEKFDAELAFNSEEINAYVNETAISTPTLSNPHELTVKYSSSNEDIAIVAEDGSVTLKGVAGDVVIDATSDETDTYKEGNASYTIHVLKLTPEVTFTAPASVALDGAINESDINVVVTAGGQPVENPEITFTSSDENVIKISNDGWKVIGIGITTITANVAGTATYESVSANVNIEVTNITPAEGTAWTETFSSKEGPNTYDISLNTIEGDNNVLKWKARNFQRSTTADMVNDQQGIRLNNKAKDTYKNPGYVEYYTDDNVKSQEGGIKRVLFQWRIPGEIDNQDIVFYVKYKEGSETITRTLTYTGINTGTVYDYAQNFNLKNNNKLTIAGSTDSDQPVIVGPITIVPYLLYTTKTATLNLTESSTYKNEDLINNLEQGDEVTYSIIKGNEGIATIATDGTVTATAAGEITIQAKWTDDGDNTITTTYKLKIEKHITISESANNTEILAANAGQTVDVTIERSPLVSGVWNSLCLPFDIDKAEVLGDAKVAILDHATLEGDVLNIWLAIVTGETLTAGTPYLVRPTEEVVLSGDYEGKKIVANVEDQEVNMVTLHGIFSPFEMTANDETKLFLGQPDAEGHNLFYASQDGSLKGMRAYFSINTPSGAPVRVGRIGIQQTPTELGGEADRLNGRQAMKVLRDGQFYIIRETKTYNAQGIEVQ